MSSTVYDPPKGGVGPLKPLSKQEMFAMKQKFKYGDGNTPWADHGGFKHTSTERDRQEEITLALTTVSPDEKIKERGRCVTARARGGENYTRECAH